MPVLHVTRAKANWAARFRRMKVEIDGRVVAKLRPEQQASVELPAGDHQVVARMDWMTGGPVSVRLDEGQEARVEVAMSMRSLTTGFGAPEEGIEVRVV